MSKFIGRLVNVGIGKETSRGTAVTPSYWIPKMSLSLDDKIQQAVDDSSVGVIQDAEGASITEKYMDGSLSGIIGIENFGLWLLAAMGTDTPALVQTGVYDHVYSVLQTAQHPALTIAHKDPNDGNGLRHTLSMVDSLEISAELNDYVKYTVNFRSNANATGSALTPSYTTENFFLPQHGIFKHATSLAGLGAASAISVKSMRLTITKNVEDDQVLGALAAADRLNKQFQVEGTVELIYDDRTFIDTIMLGDLAKAIRMQFINTDVTIGASSNPTLTIDLAKVKLSEVARTQDNDDLVRQTLTFKSFYSLSDSQSIAMTLRNTTASY